MTLVRHCDACHREFNEREYYLDLMLEKKKDDEDSEITTYGDFCYPCVERGAAIEELMAELKEKDIIEK